jgi:hypothetical protein
VGSLRGWRLAIVQDHSLWCTSWLTSLLTW